MFSSYRPEDVTILLKDITGQIAPQSTEERERRIQSGGHYSEMLPVEYEPSPEYLGAYSAAMERYTPITAWAVARTAELIWRDLGERVVLVSLARAGTPIGILLKRYLRARYGAEVPHYTISIIRGRGIDRNAMDYILARHDPASLQFVDGWTGKGAIQRQLEEAMEDYPQVDPGLAVLSDPACVARRCGTHDDFLIPSSCLNATVSGLLSRTVLRGDLIGPGDFHGAVCYESLRDRDLTYSFIREIEGAFPAEPPAAAPSPPPDRNLGMEEVRDICKNFGVRDINLVKPGIGEATRVLLRRLPWKLLVRSLDDSEHLGHLYQLAQEKHVEVLEYPLQYYRACGIIRSLADT